MCVRCSAYSNLGVGVKHPNINHFVIVWNSILPMPV
jgi:hypothetical protein